jgi:hypothetical protein
MKKYAGDLSTILRHLGVGAALAAPAGAGLYGLKHLIDSPSVMTLPERTVDLPVLTGTTKKSPTLPSITAGTSRDVTRHDAKGVEVPSTYSAIKSRVTTNADKPATLKKKEKKKEKPEKKASATIPHIVGAGIGMGAGFTAASTGTSYLRKRQLASALLDRKNEFSRLLQEEQRMAAMGKKAAQKRLTKAGSNVFLRPVSRLAGEAHNAFNALGDNPLQQALIGTTATTALLASALTAYRRATASDENRAVKKKIKDSLKERLQGHDATRGGSAPMTIQVRSPSVARQPLKPGTTSLHDPDKGRDVLSFL